VVVVFEVVVASAVTAERTAPMMRSRRARL
jgi:hypothetical protein